MSANSSAPANASDPTAAALPVLLSSLLLPARLQAQKDVYVCALTLVFWDMATSVPAAYSLVKQPGWPLLKVLYWFIRALLIAQFVITGVSVFDPYIDAKSCSMLARFNPICSIFLLLACSIAQSSRMFGMSGRSKMALYMLGGTTILQVALMSIGAAFFAALPLAPGQGCISGPRHNWVGVYWLAPTLFQLVALGFVVSIAAQSRAKFSKVSAWKTSFAHGVHFYAIMALVHLVNMLVGFIVVEQSASDAAKTMINSLALSTAAILTVRIIQNVNGDLSYGGGPTQVIGSRSIQRGLHSSSRNLGAHSSQGGSEITASRGAIDHASFREAQTFTSGDDEYEPFRSTKPKVDDDLLDDLDRGVNIQRTVHVQS